MLKGWNDKHLKARQLLFQVQVTLLSTLQKRLQQSVAKVVALSDSNGYIYDPNGINLDVVKQIKEVERGKNFGIR